MKTAIIIGVLALAVVAFFHEVILGPRLLLDTDPSHWHPWRNYVSEDSPDQRAHKTDNVLTYLPRRVELSRSIRSGRLPMWNPYVFGGTPFFADPQSRTLYPISLLLVPLDPKRAMGYDVAIHFLIAMVGMYLFLRVIGAATFGSLAGAISYGFCSFLFTRMGHPTFVASASWIPYLFYGFERARRSEIGGTILLTVFLILGYLAGFPQVFLFGVGTLVIYAVYLSVDGLVFGDRVSALKSAKILLISGVCSLLILCVHIVPFMEFVRNSFGLGIGFEDMKQIYLSSPLLLIRGLLPDFFGNPVQGTDWVLLTRDSPHLYSPNFMVYCGSGCVLAALGAVAFIRESRHVRAFVLLLLLSIGLATSPLMLLLAYKAVPFFGFSKVDRISVIACFTLSVLGGLGLSMVWREERREPRKRFAIIVLSVMGAVLVGFVVMTLAGDSWVASLAERFRSLPESIRDHARTSIRSAQIQEWSRDSLSEWLAYEKAQVGRGIVLGSLSSGLLLLCAWKTRRFRVIGTAAAVLFLVCLSIETGLAGRTYLANQPADTLADTPGLLKLRETLGTEGKWRTQSLKESGRESFPFESLPLPANTNQIFGIHSLEGTGTMVPIGHEVVKKRFLDLRVEFGRQRGTTGISRPRILIGELMSVRYFLANNTKPPSSPSTIFTAISRSGNIVSPLRMARVGDDTRLALCQNPTETVNMNITVPPVTALDFSIGIEAKGQIVSDSVFFLLSCVSEADSIEFIVGLDTSRDRGEWFPFRMDLSSVSGMPVRIALRVTVSRPDPNDRILAAWSGLELVFRDCEVERVVGGYVVDVGGMCEVLSLDLRSGAEEIPIGIIRDGGGESVRWIRFSDEMPSRQLLVDLRDKQVEHVFVRSDSAFRIERCRMIHSRRALLDYGLIYDGDMYIYENFAAFEKGICIPREMFTRVERGEEKGFMLSNLEELGAMRCGRCRIVSYEPERIRLDVSAEKDCILLFQDVYYPGWSGIVDGKPVEIHNTDVGIRAVEIGRGDHRVVMEYKPLSLKLGLILSCLGLGLLTVWVWKSTQRAVSTASRD